MYKRQDIEREDNLDLENLHEFGIREKSILVVFFCSIVLLVYGVLKLGWYMDEKIGRAHV